MDVALGYFNEGDYELNEGDLSKPPASGIEYLLRVQREANQCPDVVIAKRPQQMETYSFEEEPYCDAVKTRQEYTPLLKHQLRISADFANLRQNFLHYKTQDIPCDVQLPRRSDFDQWLIFCFGKNACTKNAHERNMNDGLLNLDVGHQPLLSILKQINQPLAALLLAKHLQYFQANGFSSQQGHWFFALLLCLDKPTPPEILSLLRELARQCINFRDSLTTDNNNNEDVIWQMNLFVVIVSRYFGQADLSLT